MTSSCTTGEPGESRRTTKQLPFASRVSKSLMRQYPPSRNPSTTTIAPLRLSTLTTVRSETSSRSILLTISSPCALKSRGSIFMCMMSIRGIAPGSLDTPNRLTIPRSVAKMLMSYWPQCADCSSTLSHFPVAIATAITAAAKATAFNDLRPNDLLAIAKYPHEARVKSPILVIGWANGTSQQLDLRSWRPLCIVLRSASAQCELRARGYAGAKPNSRSGGCGSRIEHA